MILVLRIVFAGSGADSRRSRPAPSPGRPRPLVPRSIAATATALPWVLVLLASSTYSLGRPVSTLTISLSYRRLAGLPFEIPLLGLLAGVVTTIEDARSPRERLPYDFSP